MSITRHLEPPDQHGIVDVQLVAAPAAGDSRLEGYFGPRNAVADSARDDYVDVPRGDGRVAVLVKVRVDEEHRWRRIGTALVSDFLELCRSHDIEAVYLYAEISDDEIDLVRWYERLGFRRLHEGDCEDPEMVAHLVDRYVALPAEGLGDRSLG